MLTTKKTTEMLTKHDLEWIAKNHSWTFPNWMCESKLCTDDFDDGFDVVIMALSRAIENVKAHGKDTSSLEKTKYIVCSLNWMITDIIEDEDDE